MNTPDPDPGAPAPRRASTRRGRAEGDGNLVLRGHLKELGWTVAGFASRIRERCRVLDLDAKVDPGTVARWCNPGTTPGPDLAAPACHVLSSALRRTVTPASLGWPEPTSTIAVESLDYRDLPHAVRTLTRLWELDAMGNRRQFLRYTVAAGAFALGSREALVMPPDTDISHAGTTQVDEGDAELIEHQTALYTKLDAEHGGGKFRRPFAAFLESHAGAVLNGSFNARLGRRLYGATTDASIQLAFMAYDDRQPGMSMRYYLQAMRLAQGLGDGARIARVHIHEARLEAEAHPENLDRNSVVTLARSAVLAAVASPQRVRAYAAITEARAWAFTGNPDMTVDAVARARGAFRRANQDTHPGWLEWFDESELEGQAAWAFAVAGLPAPGAEALSAARAKPAALARDNVGLLITAAELARLSGDADQHAELTRQAAEGAGRLTSRRTAARIERLRQGLPLASF